jgi:uncharacterized protein involved in exopolysaccharide biosynthesis
MRTLIRCAALLYPASWRARYGDELETLLEDVGPGWAEFFDICGGAIKMQLMRGNSIRFVAACALAGVLIAGLLVWRTPGQYRSQAVLRVAPGGDVEQLRLAEEGVLSRRSLANVIQKYGLYPEERKREPLEDVVGAMRNRNIRIQMLQPRTANVFAVAFNYSDPARAQTVTKDLAAQFTGAMKLEILDPPSLPERPFAPNRFAWLGAGLLLGSCAAVLILGIRGFRRTAQSYGHR